jgi:Fe-S-cluster-containing hydrogenase component 2
LDDADLANRRFIAFQSISSYVDARYSVNAMPRNTPLMIHIVPGKCDFCGCCVGVCPEDAIELMESEIRIIDERCTNCRKCVWACPWEVIEFHREGVESLPKTVTLP